MREGCSGTSEWSSGGDQARRRRAALEEREVNHSATKEK